MKKILGGIIWTAMLAGSSIIVSAAPVAQLSDVQGKVLISKNQGFEAASVGDQLDAGTTIFVGTEASATYYYSGADCAVNLSEGTVMVVAGEAPCAARQDLAAAHSVFREPAPIVGDPPATESAQASATPVIMGTIGAAALLGVAVYELTTNDSGPVSSNTSVP